MYAFSQAELLSGIREPTPGAAYKCRGGGGALFMREGEGRREELGVFWRERRGRWIQEGEKQGYLEA